MTGQEAKQLWTELQAMAQGVPVYLAYDGARREYVVALHDEDGELSTVGDTLAEAVRAMLDYDEDDEDDDA